MSNKFFICCDEATTICNKSQYKEASFWEIVKLKVHVLRCKLCGLYSKQNATLTKVCTKHLNTSEVDHKLCELEKELLQTEIAKRIK